MSGILEALLDEVSALRADLTQLTLRLLGDASRSPAVPPEEYAARAVTLLGGGPMKSGDLRRSVECRAQQTWVKVGKLLATDARVQRSGTHNRDIVYSLRAEAAEPKAKAEPATPKGRPLAAIVDEALVVLQRDPTRAWKSGELRAAVKCPEPRWGAAARDLGKRSGVSSVSGRYQFGEQIKAPTAELARQVAALLEASGEPMTASEIREACAIKSDVQWAKIVEHLGEFAAVKVSGERGARRYRWDRKAAAQEVRPCS